MTFNNILLGTVASLFLYLAYSVGHRRGLDSAPEYVAFKVADQTKTDEAWAKWMTEYESSQEKVCDQIFELVLDYDAESLALDHRERGDDF